MLKKKKINANEKSDKNNEIFEEEFDSDEDDVYMNEDD